MTVLALMVAMLWLYMLTGNSGKLEIHPVSVRSSELVAKSPLKPPVIKSPSGLSGKGDGAIAALSDEKIIVMF